MAEVKQQQFSINVKLVIIVDKTVKAASYADALELIKDLNVSDFVTFKTGVGHSDSNPPQVVSISNGDWLE